MVAAEVQELSAIVSEATPGTGVSAETAGTAAPAPSPASIKVLLPLPLRGALDYLPPGSGAAPLPGQFVRVSLGSRRVVGVVWDEQSDGEVPAERLKPVIEILP